MTAPVSPCVHLTDLADVELERHVKALLMSRSFLSFRRLTVVAQAGVVTLLGQLPTYHEKQIVQETVSRIAGVRRVVDGIRIKTDAQNLE